MTVAAIESVARCYKGGVGVIDATLEVRAGEIVGIRGPSASGKSTLLRLLSGVERPDSGTLSYAGQIAWTRRRWATYPRPGYVMPISQDPAASLDPRWAIWRTITEPLTVGISTPTPARRERARELLDKAGMRNIDLSARPGSLSGGQCQRIAILRAICARPALVVADEPTARQDVITAASMAAHLRALTSAGTAMVVVSHDRLWLEGLADRVHSLVDGRLSGAPD